VNKTGRLSVPVGRGQSVPTEQPGWKQVPGRPNAGYLARANFWEDPEADNPHSAEVRSHGWRRAVPGGLRGAEGFENGFRQVFVDFFVPRDGLKSPCFVVGIPIMLTAVTDEFTAKSIEFFYQFFPLHAVKTSSSTFLT